MVWFVVLVLAVVFVCCVGGVMCCGLCFDSDCCCSCYSYGGLYIACLWCLCVSLICVVLCYLCLMVRLNCGLRLFRVCGV